MPRIPGGKGNPQACVRAPGGGERSVLYRLAAGGAEVGPRAVAGPAGVVGDGDQNLADVVRVVGLREVVAEAGGGVEHPAGVVLVPLERRVGGGAGDLLPPRPPPAGVAPRGPEV